MGGEKEEREVFSKTPWFLAGAIGWMVVPFTEPENIRRGDLGLYLKIAQ